MTNHVVIALHRLAESTAADVARACDRAHHDQVLWTGTEDPPPGVAPRLLVAGLPTGTRRVPDDLVDLCTRTYPGLSMLLLCREPLARPTVSLQNGRIVLLGPPLTEQRIYSRLRILTQLPRGAPTPAQRIDSHIEALSPTVTREQLRPHWWVAGLSSADPEDEERLPLLYQEVEEGLTAVLSHRAGLGAEELSRAVNILSDHDASDAERAGQLSDLLAGSAGVLHLSARAEEWLFFWPARDAPLWLYSPSRLPSWWDLTAAIAQQPAPLLRMPAFGRDLVVALSSQAPPPAERAGNTTSDDDIAIAVHHGGPSVLELLESRLGDTPLPFSAILTEVR